MITEHFIQHIFYKHKMPARKQRPFVILFLNETTVATHQGWQIIQDVLHKKVKKGFSPNGTKLS
ncbi:hypothetical protein ACFL35_20085 [Candidatus Riflebacteria bacterium]